MSLQEISDNLTPKLLPEVFLLIFSHLQKCDLKPLRFVGRMFYDLIIPFLYDKIYISPQYLNLAVFRNISQSSHLAKHVKESVYDATEFSNSVDEQGQPIVPRNPSEPSYHLYLQLARDQEELISSEEDFTHLCAGLGLMPNLVSVVVMDAWNVWTTYRSKLLTRVAGPLSRTCDLSVPQPQSPWSAWDDPSPAARTRSHRVFLTLIRALSTRNHKIHQLKYLAEAPGLSLPLHTFDLARADLQHTINVFQHLRKISLPLHTYNSSTLSQSFFQSGNVAQALSAAVNLETLELSFDAYGTRQVYPLALLFGESTTWPRLKHLFLNYLQVDAQELMDFFQRHCTSLSHLEFAFVTFRGKNWEELYNAMQDCLRLERTGTDEQIYFVLMDRETLNFGSLRNRAQSCELAIPRAE